MTPHIKKTGTCGECQAERVRLIDMPKPGDVGPNYVCAVCAARLSPPASSSKPE